MDANRIAGMREFSKEGVISMWESIRAIILMMQAVSHNPVAVEPKEEDLVQIAERPAKAAPIVEAKKRNVSERPATTITTTQPRKTLHFSKVSTVLSPNPEYEDFSKVPMASINDMGARY